MLEGPCAESEEKHEPASDADAAVVDSLKALDLNRPIREADIGTQLRNVRFVPKADVSLCRFRMPQGRVELVESPIYFVTGDYQRGTNTDGMVVSILT